MTAYPAVRPEVEAVGAARVEPFRWRRQRCCGPEKLATAPGLAGSSGLIGAFIKLLGER